MIATRLRAAALHLVLVVGALISLFPFYWTAVMATNTTKEMYQVPPRVTFGPALFENIGRLLSSIDFFGSMLNTLIVASCTTALVLFFDSIAAFAFAKYEFPGRRIMFGLLLLTYMLPMQLALIPQFVIMAELGWVGTLNALIVPAAANAFGIFWLRQYIKGAVPDDVLAAARIDGAGFFRQYWHVGLPAIRPGLAFLGITTFIAAWNDYTWPLIVMVDPSNLTLQVALSQLNTVHNLDYSLVLTGALLAVLPLAVVFVLFARGFIRDAMKGALRG
ncbi:carbohydrate ABC transporter membrane protein 2 (CUT1 family) [Nonomuraea polychroma]|uniref:Carbohydrate ABC transporter membrane protein 2 (CUT1 family) n=1 Tax=Nonomuraea polychroma TaxID=46176 RepID=A0A438MQ09_9ACTN|nr:carbohydrate ABC transporter permease [Nonomuraea polychroma]RVX47541.1 carbohydrate ABC transporter membrane protein 2 (CUT1 family) [Nonomuraea polychroma]